MSALALGEAAAVALGVAYLLLAVRQNILCWYAAFLSTTISVWLFWNVSLLMESGLNVHYMAMAVYGWYQWKFGGAERTTLPVSRWRPLTHVGALALILVMTMISGKLLATNTGAAWPYLDSFTTWASVLTTFMVARKILENWI